MAHSDTCSCGETTDHVVARRTTIDGKTVLFWSDGLVTFGAGFAIKGIGRARAAYARRYDRRAADLVAGDVELFEASKVGALVQAARRAVRDPGVRDDASARTWMRLLYAKATK